MLYTDINTREFISRENLSSLTTFTLLEATRHNHLTVYQDNIDLELEEYHYRGSTINMKAVTQTVGRPVEFGIKKDSPCSKIVKTKMDETAEEMQACFLKLKELVPSIPQDRKLSKTQLLQHVIDYILDLEVALDFNPEVLALPVTPSAMRSPLSEKAEPNNIVADMQIPIPMEEDSCESK